MHRVTDTPEGGSVPFKGFSWQAVADIVKTRNSYQCRSQWLVQIGVWVRETGWKIVCCIARSWTYRFDDSVDDDDNNDDDTTTTTTATITTTTTTTTVIETTITRTTTSTTTITSRTRSCPRPRIKRSLVSDANRSRNPCLPAWLQGAPCNAEGDYSNLSAPTLLPFLSRTKSFIFCVFL